MKLEDKNYRTIHIDGNRANEDSRTVPASLSSDTPIMRSFGNETLVHDEKSIDMTRAKRGLPLLFSHDSDKPIGRVEGITLDEGKLRGNLRFAKNKRAEECWQDVKDGILTDVSIGYRINDYEETDDGIRATNWLIYEASVVTCPADSNVGIYRSNPAPKQEEATMDKTETPNSEAPTGDSVVVDIQMASKRALDKGTEAGIRAERNRVSDINSIFEFHQGDEVRALQSKCIDDGLTLEQSQRSLLLMLGGQAEPLASDFKQTGYRNEVVMGKTDVEKTMKGMQDVLYKRAGLGDDIDVSGNEFLGHDLSSMARETLRVAGVSTRGMDNYSIVGTAFKRDVTETAFDKAVADFPSLLADVANKSLLKGYNESEESWQRWCATGSLPDFKTGNRPNLSLYPTPAEVAENGAFALADMSDWNETIALKTVGSIFSITRQAIVNDDLSAFTRIPRAQGRAAARSVGDSVYALLTATVTMGDSNLLFDDVNHTNVYSAGAPSVATVDEIRTGMALQTDPAAIALGIRPAYLICPIALEGVATTLRNAQFDPDTAEASGNTSGNRPNWVAGTFEVVPEHRLDANSATIWYMAASSSIYDTVEVDFLNGVNAPMLESRDGFKIDGVEMKVRLDYGVAPLDWRTLAINGAAPV